MFSISGIQLREISDAASYLAPISEVDRAYKYPYDAPEGGFVLASGRLLHLEQAQLDQMDEDPNRGVLAGRTPVLSVGSNRAPVQLLRKFGPDSLLPVTPARLHDCDITHAAILGYYAAVPCTAFPSPGTIVDLNVVWLHDCDITHAAILGYYAAVPCTAFPSPGTIVDLNVVWLDDYQLAQMHRTEGINVAYDFVVMETVEHQFTVRPGPVFGYAARAGVLDCGDGEPAGLSAIPSHGRKYKTLTQAEANAKLRELAMVDDDRSMIQFITEMQADKSARDAIIERLRPHAIHAHKPPWRVQAVNIDGVDAYL
jgi:hypothetical protein